MQFSSSRRLWVNEGPELISTLGSNVLIDGIELVLTENYFSSVYSISTAELLSINAGETLFSTTLGGIDGDGTGVVVADVGGLGSNFEFSVINDTYDGNQSLVDFSVKDGKTYVLWNDQNTGNLNITINASDLSPETTFTTLKSDVGNDSGVASVLHTSSTSYLFTSIRQENQTNGYQIVYKDIDAAAGTAFLDLNFVYGSQLSVALLSDQEALLSYIRSENGWDTYVSKIDLTTGEVLSESRGNFSIFGDQVNPLLTQLSDGRTLLTWQDNSTESTIYGRYLDQSGVFTTLDIDLGIGGVGYDVTPNADGGFLVLHRSNDIAVVSEFDENAELVDTTAGIVARPFSSAPLQLGNLTDDSTVTIGVLNDSLEYYLATIRLNNRPEGVLAIEGSPVEDAELSPSNAITDADGFDFNADEYQYQWIRGEEEIIGATSASYTLTQADVGKTIGLQLKFTDEHGTSEEVLTTMESVVSNVNDEPQGDLYIAGQATEDQVLTVTSSVTDEDGINADSIVFKWKRNDEEVPDVSGDNYQLTQADVGAVISVEQWYVDNFDKQEVVVSSPTEVVLNVNDAPVITSPPAIEATEDVEYRYQITGSDEDFDDTFFFDSEVLPAWLGLDGGTGELSGIPEDSDVGEHEITVKVVDALGAYTEEFFTITVENVNDAPTVSSDPITAATEYTAYTYEFTAVDIDNYITVTSETLPDWLSLEDLGSTSQINAEGKLVGDVEASIRISGTPTYEDVGEHDVTLRVTDEAGEFAEQSFTITVEDVPNALPEGDLTLFAYGFELLQTTEISSGIALTSSMDGISDADGLGEFSYQWHRGDNEISGAASSTYTLTEDDISEEISLHISYTDGRGTTETLQSIRSSAVKLPNNDTTGAVTISGQMIEGETLTAITSSLADADGLGELSYQWLRDDEQISGASGATYLISSDDINSVLSVQVSYTDGLGTSESITSNSTPTINPPHEYADNFTIESSFGQSVYEGTLPDAAEGSGGEISFTINQVDPQIRSVYVALQPMSGQTSDYWDNFWSNKIGGEPADQFALSTFTSVDGGASTVTYTLNADSSIEENETFLLSIYESNMDFALGRQAIKSFEFTVLDDDAPLDLSVNISVGEDPPTGLALEFVGSSASSKTANADNGTLDYSMRGTFSHVVLESSTYSADIAISDVISSLKHIVGLETLDGAALHAADVDNDDKVAIADVISQLKHIVGLETLNTFDLVNTAGARVTEITEETTDLQLVLNGDVDLSTALNSEYVYEIY